MSTKSTPDKAEEAKAETATDEKPKKGYLRLYNKATGTLTHGDFTIKGASFANVPEEIAKLWLEQYPDRVISAEDAVNTISGTSAALDEANAKVAAQEKEIAALKAKLEKAK